MVQKPKNKIKLLRPMKTAYRFFGMPCSAFIILQRGREIQPTVSIFNYTVATSAVEKLKMNSTNRRIDIKKAMTPRFCRSVIVFQAILIYF